MTLNKSSVKWAIEFTKNHSDGDIFPPIAEMSMISQQPDGFINSISDKPLSNFHVQACRRFIVPKDEISYRQATQLYPQDSIILTAIIFQYGQGIEKRRLDKSKIFSYRFLPNEKNGLYGSNSLWNDFWNLSNQKSYSFSHILYCDIADFYNQINHHTVQQQLSESGFPNQAIQWIKNLLESTTAGVSRGVPIGPHAIHLIAECTLIPLDNSLVSSGIEFIRYADDIIVFCKSEKEAHNALAQIATKLDKQQRLMLQKHKTKIYEAKDFQNICIEMLQDRPISPEEDAILQIVKKYSGGNPYITITYNDVSPEDWKMFDEGIVKKIIVEYIKKDEIDFIRLRWFFRRLTQVGHPGALKVVLEYIDILSPCMANICAYITSIQSIPSDDWKTIGEQLLNLLNSELLENNEFFRLSVLSLFSKNEHINHFSKLASIYTTSEASAKREILLASKINSAIDWVREHKENYNSMDQWQKSAFIFCISKFPKDEKKYFINHCHFQCEFDEEVAKISRLE